MRRLDKLFMNVYDMILKLKHKKEKTFNIIIGDKVLGINDAALLVKFYIKVGSKCIPNKLFIGMPFVTLSCFLLTLIKIKDNIPETIYIHNSGYVLILNKNENQITVFYRKKYKIVNHDSKSLIRSEHRILPTINKRIYEGNYLFFIRQIYSIGLELKEKFKDKDKQTSGEFDFEISLNKFQKYLTKIERRNA